VLQSNGYHVSCVGKWGVGDVNNTGAPHLKGVWSLSLFLTPPCSSFSSLFFSAGCTDYFGVLNQVGRLLLMSLCPSLTAHIVPHVFPPPPQDFAHNMSALDLSSLPFPPLPSIFSHIASHRYPSLPEFTYRYPAFNGSLVYEPIPFPVNANASRDICMQPNSSCVWSHKLWTDAALRGTSLSECTNTHTHTHTHTLHTHTHRLTRVFRASSDRGAGRQGAAGCGDWQHCGAAVPVSCLH
jgi:hypothetical protein